MLLIGSLLFLFFNEYGILTLMKKQSSIRKQKKALQKTHSEKKKFELDNKKIMNYEEDKLDDLRKQNGITLPNEYYYIIEPE